MAECQSTLSAASTPRLALVLSVIQWRSSRILTFSFLFGCRYSRRLNSGVDVRSIAVAYHQSLDTCEAVCDREPMLTQIPNFILVMGYALLSLSGSRGSWSNIFHFSHSNLRPSSVFGPSIYSGVIGRKEVSTTEWCDFYQNLARM